MAFYTWGRTGGYEVSSVGDRRFSAFNAILSDGRSIEEHYQCDVKGYDPGGRDWKKGKGKPPLWNVDLWASYLALWRRWAEAHPDLMEVLRAKVADYENVLSDRFASTPVNQARALAHLLTDRLLLEPELSVFSEIETRGGTISSSVESLLSGLEFEASRLSYRRCPAWLGDFEFCIFGGKYGRKGTLSDYPNLTLAASILERRLPKGFDYNTVFVQRYLPGFRVYAHRDPKSNVGATAILTFGDYQDAPMTVVQEMPYPIFQKRGEVLTLPCYNKGVYGPDHGVDGSPMRSGVRYTLIINSVE
jgi:hypothetical protein